eukprot:scaffold118126_cov46-Prasinocladus_malaysianus.AAC.1
MDLHIRTDGLAVTPTSNSHPFSAMGERKGACLDNGRLALPEIFLGVFEVWMEARGNLLKLFKGRSLFSWDWHFDELLCNH